MTSNKAKLKILALHGYRQSDKIFSAKLGSLRKSFKKEIDFTFVRAPHKVPPIQGNCDKDEPAENNEETDRNSEYGWWFNTEDKVFHALEPSNLSVGFDESIELVKKTFEEKGPFDGVLGFSQGASFVSMLCAMQQKKLLPNEFNFAIIISGFKSLCKPHEVFYNDKLLLTSLHVYGEGDKVIPSKIAEELSETFINKQTIVHEGGHFVAGKKSIYNDFIKHMFEKKNNENKNS